MKQLFALLFLVIGASAQITTMTLPHTIDSAVTPKVSYVDDNDEALRDKIHELKDTINTYMTGGLLGTSLSSTGDLKLSIDSDNNATTQRFYIDTDGSDTLFRILEDGATLIDGATTINGNVTLGTGFDFTGSSTSDITTGGNLIVGSGAAGIDNTLTFDGETSDGVITWKEDEGKFLFDSSITIGSLDTMIVNGASVESKVAIHSAAAGTVAELEVHRHSNTAGQSSTMYGARSRGTEGSETVVQSGDNLLDILAVGYDGTDYALSSGVYMEVDGTPGADDMPGRIVFKVSPDGSQTPAEAMRISQDKSADFAGVVGINGTHTDGTLHVVSGSAGTVAAVVEYDDIVVEGNLDVGMSFLSPDNRVGAIAFGVESKNDFSLWEIDYQANFAALSVDKSSAELRFLSGTYDRALDLDSNQNGIFHENLTIGSGDAGQDYTLTFDGETNDGLLTWMEDEDEFQFSDSVQVPDLDVTGTTTTTDLVVTGTFAFDTIAGDLTVTGDLTVDGSTALDTISNNLTVTGSVSSTGLTVTGSGNSITGGLVVNDAGSPVDFRVETSGAANTFVVDGSTGQVDVGDGTQGSIATFTTSAVTIKKPTVVSNNTIDVGGDVDITLGGSFYRINYGAATDGAGQATLSSGTVTVSNTNIAANDLIFLTRAGTSSAYGHLRTSISAATSFTITSDNASDDGTINYLIIKQTGG